MLPYQHEVVNKFVKLLPPETAEILEIGSDMNGEVASAIAEKTHARVTGINLSPDFLERANSRFQLIRADGRSMPFPDNSFDAILSVATMEHVNGLDVFLSEVSRVLRPKGVFFTEFSPLWSSALGHHVFAVVGSKEARFWKPGKNPVPDYAHLLMTPDELRSYLRSGPCSEELIEPIIEWIYVGTSLNRCHYEEYRKAFRTSSLIVQKMHFDYDKPDHGTLTRLNEKYGRSRNFTCSSISVVFRKKVNGSEPKLFLFKTYVVLRRMLVYWLSLYKLAMRRLFKILALPFRVLLQTWRVLFLPD